jgi:hypothetical protein
MPHPMNGQILAKMVLKQRKKKQMVATAMKKICRDGTWVDRRELGHQQNGQRT